MKRLHVCAFREIEEPYEFHQFVRLPVELQVVILKVAVRARYLFVLDLRFLSWKLHDATCGLWASELTTRARKRMALVWEDHDAICGIARRFALNLTGGFIWNNRIFGTVAIDEFKDSDQRAKDRFISYLIPWGRVGDAIRLGAISHGEAVAFIKGILRLLSPCQNIPSICELGTQLLQLSRIEPIACMTLPLGGTGVPTRRTVKAVCEWLIQASDANTADCQNYLSLLEECAPAVLRRALSGLKRNTESTTYGRLLAKAKEQIKRHREWKAPEEPIRPQKKRKREK